LCACPELLDSAWIGRNAVLGSPEAVEGRYSEAVRSHLVNLTVPSTFLFSFRTSGHVATGYGRKADRCSFLSRSVDGFGQKVVLQAFFSWRARGPVLLDAPGHVIDLKSELVLLPKSSRIQALGLTRSLSNLQLLSLIAKGALQVDCPAFRCTRRSLFS
jgi:hypothetical protein